MEHFYHTIKGYFSYQHIYQNAVAHAAPGSLFVEIGSFNGCSSSFMAVEIINSGKPIDFRCIDPMLLNSHYIEDASKAPEFWGDYGPANFHKNMSPVKGFYRLHQKLSKDAVNDFDDNSIDFIMIDGDHESDAVRDDIINYFPKMKNGSVMWGDDAWAPTIWSAAQEGAAKVGQQIELVGGSHFLIRVSK